MAIAAGIAVDREVLRDLDDLQHRIRPPTSLFGNGSERAWAKAVATCAEQGMPALGAGSSRAVVPVEPGLVAKVAWNTGEGDDLNIFEAALWLAAPDERAEVMCPAHAITRDGVLIMRRADPCGPPAVESRVSRADREMTAEMAYDLAPTIREIRRVLGRDDWDSFTAELRVNNYGWIDGRVVELDTGPPNPPPDGIDFGRAMRWIRDQMAVGDLSLDRERTRPALLAALADEEERQRVTVFCGVSAVTADRLCAGERSSVRVTTSRYFATVLALLACAKARDPTGVILAVRVPEADVQGGDVLHTYGLRDWPPPESVVAAERFERAEMQFRIVGDFIGSERAAHEAVRNITNGVPPFAGLGIAPMPAPPEVEAASAAVDRLAGRMRLLMSDSKALRKARRKAKRRENMDRKTRERAHGSSSDGQEGGL